MDRRIKYTRMVLNESLIGFLEQKDITQITVTEICRAADVNRSTYYAHYRDAFDHLAKLKAELLEGLTGSAEGPLPEGLGSTERKEYIFREILRYTESRKHVFRILLMKGADHNLQRDILKVLSERVFGGAREAQQDGIERNYRLIYAANGCFGIYYEWLLSENTIGIDRAARMMAELSEGVTG